MKGRVWVLSGVMTLASAGGAARIEAQGRLVGTVYDSVAAKPLSAAFVQLALVSDPSVSRSVRADDRGRFRVDSMAAGTWVMAVMHPRIDSLGIEQLARPVTTRGAGEQRMNLSIPSARSLMREVCGDTVIADGSGYVHGRLRRVAGSGVSSGTSESAARGQVEVQWVDMMVSVTKGVGVTRVPRRTATVAQADGAFTVCGVPAGGTVRVRGAHGTDTTGMIEMVVPEHGIARLDLTVGTVSHVDVDSVPMRRGQGVLRGRILGPLGQPLPNASAGVWGTGLTARTDSSGYWQLRQLPMGTHTVDIRAIGFQAEQHIVDIGDLADHELHSTLERMVTLDTVRTRALREQLFVPEIRAFEQRRRTGHGSFRGPAEVDQIMPSEAAHLFRTVPGVRVIPDMRSSLMLGYRILMRGGAAGASCVPDLIIDRVRIANDLHEGLIDDWVLFSQVRAVEVYQAITGTPPEFMRAGNQCGTIVIWTGRR
ncbi:MAG: carboxypeptidase regulatory-like domain-containing protein [Gemmatimonadaceae bacterium]|nr:carboxypeptidase regulatory-like domain-containing protein [Gemmatimonadaceae bacterium]